jgi:DNA-binding MarR family transcriptional regulator
MSRGGETEDGGRGPEVNAEADFRLPSSPLRPPSPIPHASDCTRAWQTLRMAHERVAQRLGAALGRECGLSITEFDVLLALHAHAGPGVRIGALLETVPLSQPALSRLVSRLETRGLLARSDAADDKRAIVVCLPAAGAALAERAITVHARAVHEALTSRFSEDEQAELLRILSQIGR